MKPIFDFFSQIGAFFTDPVGYIGAALSGWLTSLPLDWLLGAAFIAGLLLGAAIGKWGVAALGVAAAVFIAWRSGRGAQQDSENVPVDTPDAVAAPKRRKRRARPVQPATPAKPASPEKPATRDLWWEEVTGRKPPVRKAKP